MITTVTLNPCNDWTLVIPSFTYGGMNRVESEELFLAGKGFNLAKASARLGHRACALGFLYEENGASTQKMLEMENVHVDCVWSPGKIRTNIKLFDAEKRVITEINQPGVPVSPELLLKIEEKVRFWSAKSRFIVLAGSLPPGSPVDFYKTLAKVVDKPCKVVIDAEGKKLLCALEAKPYMIKPNLFELQSIAGKRLENSSDLSGAANDILRQGVEVVAISLGEKGALLYTSAEGWYAPALKLEVKGTVGAGDCMLAGLCCAALSGLNPKEMLRMGMASAADAVTRPGTELCQRQGVLEMLDRIEVVPAQQFKLNEL